MVYVISGVAFTGNKGASGMAEAIIQNLSSYDPDNRFYVYTYCPRQDAKVNLYDNVTILGATPKAVVINFFLALWSTLCIFLKLPGFFYKKHRLTNAILESDYWLDTSGISFVDGREKFLIYNILSIWPALCTSTLVITLGWSHKYDEVLEQFGINDYSVNYNEICEEKLLALVEKAQGARDGIVLRIKNNLPQVKEQLKQLYSSISE